MRFDQCVGVVAFVLFSVLAAPTDASVVGEQAESAGLERCSDVWENIGDFVQKGTGAVGAHSRFHGDDSDGHMATMAAEEVYSDGSVLALLGAAPVVHGGCDAVAFRLIYQDKSCLEVSHAESDFEFGGHLSERIIRLTGPGHRYLMPAGDGCLVVISDLVIE